jgi:hypothetical protein
MGYISTSAVAEKRQKLKEAFPDYKFSVRKDGYSGISVTILEGTTQLLEDGENYRNVNVYAIDRVYADRPEVRDVLSKIYSILDDGNKRRETGDYGTQPDFYIYLYIGESNAKPYKVIPKKSSGRTFKKGFKKFGEKKTEGFTLVKSCGNGWNLFLKKDENSDKPFTYRLVKDNFVSPVGKEQFYALKGEMLDVGFLWSVKAQCFETNRFNEIPESTIINACVVLSKYFPITETIPTEDLPPPPTQSTTKIPIKSITLADEYASYTTFKEVDDFFKIVFENEEKLSDVSRGDSDKYKIELKWEDGSNITDKLEISARGKNDWNPFRESLSDYYYKKITDGTKKFVATYYYDLNTELKNLSFEDLAETQPPDSNQEVNLEQLIGDMNLLIDLETDNDKRMELAGYRNDLQILLSLNN